MLTIGGDEKDVHGLLPFQNTFVRFAMPFFGISKLIATASKLALLRQLKLSDASFSKELCPKKGKAALKGILRRQINSRRYMVQIVFFFRLQIIVP